jgi:hypothetical protein
VIRELSSKKLSRNVLGLLGLLSAILWFCDEILLGGKIPFFRDLGTYFYPIKFSLAQSFKGGEFPLWNRNMAAGFPLMAAFQPAVFYPLSILFFLFPFFAAVRLTFLTHFLVAAFGAYYLCRLWKYPIQLCVIGAILFALGGTTVSLSNLLNHFQSGVWLPWMVLCWERFLHTSSWKTFVALVLILLVALLAGSPEIYIFSLGLLLIDGIRVSLGDPEHKVSRTMLSLVAANLVVALLGMVQFLPTMELLLQSRRDGSIPFQEATFWSLQPASLIGIFFPDKEVDGSLAIGVRLFFARDIPFFLSHYLGVLSFLGISAWVRYASCKERLLIVSLISTSLFLALGNWTPVYRFLYDQIALFRIIRFPEKYVFLTYALLLFVVLKGLAALHSTKNSERNFPVYVLLGLLFVWATAYLSFRLYPKILFGLIAIPPFSPNQVATSSVATTVASIFFNLERQIGITGALLVLYFCTAKGVLRASLHHGFLILIVLFDLSGVHKPLLFPLNPAAVTNTNRILASANSENGRLFYYPGGKNLHPSSLTVTGWPPFAKAVALSYENLLPNAGALYGFRYFQEIDALTRQGYNDFLDFANLVSPENRIRLFRALNIRYIVAFQPLVIPGMRLLHRFPEHFSWLYEIDRPLPRAYIVSHMIYETQPAKTLRLLSSDEFDPSQQIILKEQVALETGQTSRGEANIVRDSNNGVVIDALLTGPGFLVLTDSHYPGWKVYVDGSERKLFRANYFFRAVALPAGKHRVDFIYDPVSFKIGAAVSTLSAGLFMMISIIIYFRHKRRLQASAVAV